MLTRLLHIENDALVARAVSRVLRRKGYEVETAASCREAREMAGSFDVAVFDIDLGDGNGVELAEELCRAGAVNHAIFFTACTDAELYMRASRTGSVVCKTQGVPALMLALIAARQSSVAKCSELTPNLVEQSRAS